MKKLSRRTFFSNSIGAAAALSLPPVSSRSAPVPPSELLPEEAPGIIDTNVNLFDWPFRKLKYGKTKALVEKLRRHRIIQAWAGSYEALFYKDVGGVNARLAEECRVSGEGLLLPFGTVNLAWPDWEEDLRLCDEVHKMRGIRVYPVYQTFDLNHPDFTKFVQLTTKRKMMIQIVGDMEDSRHHHPIVQVRDMNMAPLIDVMKQVPEANVQLVYWNHKVSYNLLAKMVDETKVTFDTSRVEGSGEVGRLLAGNSWSGNSTAIPADRFLFGSHAPYFPVEANVIKLFESPLTFAQMEGIMNGNARRLLQPV
jgi:predicted TIM-barrel fold metal-dependent hydrolase